MSSTPFDLLDDDLDMQLSVLGSQLAWTPTPDIASGVVQSMAEPTPLLAPAHRRTWLAAAAAAILFLLGGAILLGSSTVRHSVADFLGIDGLRIELGEPATQPADFPMLGTPTTMQDFARWLPFEPLHPAALGRPDAVYLRVLENGDMLGISAWQPSDTLPEAPETGLGALLLQFDPPDDMVMIIKTVGISTGSVTETTVDGERAFWIEGASDLTIFGDHGPESRPSANVLIWQQDGIGFRFESILSMTEALAVAETMEPVPGTS